MKKIKITLVTFVALFHFCFILKAQDIRINEVVASNSVYLDEDGDSPDWIELHNYGATEVSLLNWGLTDDGDNLHDWQFPDISLQPDEYLLVWASGKDRSDISYSRTLVDQGDTHNFLLPSSNPASTWNEIAFDDSSWNTGSSGFGYGDGDDATSIPPGGISVYTRITFSMSDINNLSSLILDVDYDDGFIAYINGVEVARANVNGAPPDYNTNAILDHEAQMYNGGNPDRFLIADPSSLLVDGDNVLAIQTHNISSTSSDLTMIPFLSAVFSAPSALGVEPPAILGLSSGSFHTNFKVSSNSETLYLSDENETIVYQIFVEGLQPNVSIGTSTTTSNLVYYTDTTPGAVNSSSEYLGVLSSDIIFSHDGGIVDTATLDVTLSGNEGSQVIRYTTDATEPDETSTIYASAINLTDNTVIRARVFDTDYIPSFSKSKSYIFNATHLIDVVTLATDPYNLFDEDYGIYVYGDSYDADQPYYGANFWEDWERPIHFSFYEKNTGVLGTEFNAGVKIFGGWSRANDQRSLSIFARGQYGTSEMDYPFFDTLSYDKFQALVLRNSGNDWLNTSMRDAALTSLMEGTDLEFQAFNPVATYINDEYWGMYNLREKVNEHFLASKQNVDADDINLLEGNGQIVEGTNTAYNELINYVSTTDLSIDANFVYVSDRVDIENYALYQLAQIYFNNQDWPGNNIKFWNHPEGKWRWIMYDTDFGFGIWDDNDYNEDTLSFALEAGNSSWPNPDWSTLLFRNLIENNSFRNQFINRYADELNTRFLPANVKDHFDAVFAMIQPEVDAQYTRWGGNPADASYNVGRMKTFADNRHPVVKEHIKFQFSLPDYHELTITNTDITQGYVLVNNNLNIQLSSWNGDYFETVPIELTAIAESGYQFSHWTGASTSTEATIELSLEGAIQVTPNFIVSTIENLIINEINYKSDAVVNADDWVELYNPNDVAIDVSNWMLKDDDDTHIFNFPVSTTIEAESYLVLVKDESDFNAAFPTITNYIGELGFGLGGSDAVRLYNSSDDLQDEVDYDSEAPWPTCADGLGPTLELISTDLDNNLPTSWDCINDFGSPDMANTLGVEEYDFNNIIFYPNPVRDILNINGAETELSLTIYDILGKKLFTKSVTNQVDVSFLKKGIYIIEIRIENKTSIHKLIKS